MLSPWWFLLSSLSLPFYPFSYILVLSQICIPSFLPLFFWFFCNSVTSSSSQEDEVRFTLLLGLNCTCYCLFLNEYHLILTSTYFFRFQSFETSFLMGAEYLSHMFKGIFCSPLHYLVTLTYWSGFLTGSPRPIASLSPENLSDRQILRLQSTSTESETLLCGSGICFNKASKVCDTG